MPSSSFYAARRASRDTRLTVSRHRPHSRVDRACGTLTRLLIAEALLLSVLAFCHLVGAASLIGTPSLPPPRTVPRHVAMKRFASTLLPAVVAKPRPPPSAARAALAFDLGDPFELDGDAGFGGLGGGASGDGLASSLLVGPGEEEGFGGGGDGGGGDDGRGRGVSLEALAPAADAAARR